MDNTTEEYQNSEDSGKLLADVVAARGASVRVDSINLRTISIESFDTQVKSAPRRNRLYPFRLPVFGVVTTVLTCIISVSAARYQVENQRVKTEQDMARARATVNEQNRIIKHQQDLLKVLNKNQRVLEQEQESLRESSRKNSLLLSDAQHALVELAEASHRYQELRDQDSKKYADVRKRYEDSLTEQNNLKSHIKYLADRDELLERDLADVTKINKQVSSSITSLQSALNDSVKRGSRER